VSSPLWRLGDVVWTQSLSAAARLRGIGDVLHNLFAGLNFYFGQHASAANALLVVSSGFIDLFGLFLVCRMDCPRRSRAFLGLVLLLACGRLCRRSALCRRRRYDLEASGISIFYSPSSFRHLQRRQRLFLLGHTAIAVFGAIEVARIAATGC